MHRYHLLFARDRPAIPARFAAIAPLRNGAQHFLNHTGAGQVPVKVDVTCADEPAWTAVPIWAAGAGTRPVFDPHTSRWSSVVSVSALLSAYRRMTAAALSESDRERVKARVRKRLGAPASGPIAVTVLANAVRGRRPA